VYDIDPSMSRIFNEPMVLAKYLKERKMVIDIWDGDSLMHYGTVKVLLFKHMR